MRFPAYQPPVASGPVVGHWKSALSRIIADNNSPWVYWSSSEFICIYDRFPKAKQHLLLLVNDSKLTENKVWRLSQTHLPMLKKMKTIASELTSTLTGDFLVGFHSVPSMDRLHLHIISTDFVSDSLKNKKHWNSFNSEFFLNLDTVISRMENNEDILSHPVEYYESLLKLPLHCPRCQCNFKTIPKLKAHLPCN